MKDAREKVKALPPVSKKTQPNVVRTAKMSAKSPRRGEPTAYGATDTKVPTSKQFGNTLGDRKLLETMYQADDIEEVPEDEAEIPYGVKLRFTGDPASIDAGSFWKLPPEEIRCNSRAKVRDNEGRPIVNKDNEFLVRPCLSPAIKGGTVCIKHGGGQATVRRAAELRLLSAADSVIGALIGIGLDTKQDGKARVQAINSVLDRAGIKAGTTITLDIPAYKKIAKDLFEGRYGDDEEEGADDDADSE